MEYKNLSDEDAVNIIENVVPAMQSYNFALMDIQYIQVSKTHRCIRKVYILAKDGLFLKSDFYPCIRYKDIDREKIPTLVSILQRKHT